MRDQSRSLLQALKLNLPSQMFDLDAYMQGYVTFRRFCQVYCPGTAKRRIKEAVIKSAVSAASLGFAGERQDDGSADGGQRTGRYPANAREAALAADLITASKSSWTSQGQHGPVQKPSVLIARIEDCKESDIP